MFGDIVHLLECVTYFTQDFRFAQVYITSSYSMSVCTWPYTSGPALMRPRLTGTIANLCHRRFFLSILLPNTAVTRCISLIFGNFLGVTSLDFTPFDVSSYEDLFGRFYLFFFLLFFTSCNFTLNTVLPRTSIIK